VGDRRNTGHLSKSAPWRYPRTSYLSGLSAVVILIWQSRAILGATRQPLGPDFVKCVAASALALQGRPADAYSVADEWASEKIVVRQTGVGSLLQDYPPTVLKMILPLFGLPSYNRSHRD
jgi:hypothetical protein